MNRAVNWWLRSPDPGNSTNFRNVNSNGNANTNNATNGNSVVLGSSFTRLLSGRQSNPFWVKSEPGWREGERSLPVKVNK